MAYEAAVLRRASQRLEAARTSRAEALERRREEIYRKIPRLAEIDRQLRRTIVDIISASLREGTDPVPAIGVIKDKNLSLQAERADLDRYVDLFGYSPKYGVSGPRIGSVRYLPQHEGQPPLYELL